MKALLSSAAVGVCTLWVTTSAAQAPAATAAVVGGFFGRFTLSTSTTVTVTTPMNQTETRRTREVVTVRPGRGAQMVWDILNNNRDRCVLNATRTGPSTVSFVPGQRCNMTDPVRRLRLAITLVNGTGTLRGTRLDVRVRWNVETNVLGMRVLGTGTQTSFGQRALASR